MTITITIISSGRMKSDERHSNEGATIIENQMENGESENARPNVNMMQKARK